MKFLVLGAQGQLGTDIIKILKKSYSTEDITAWDINDLDITDFAATSQSLKILKPDVIINCAAYLRVDDAEKESDKAFLVNSAAVNHLARECQQMDATLIHISTDYVFDGDRTIPYAENDCPHPINIYGISKLAGEYAVRANLQKYYIFRVCGLYGLKSSIHKKGNFVETMIRLSKEKDKLQVVDDQILTPTYTLDAAVKIVETLQTNSFGLYHLTNDGGCSWYEFTQEIFKIMGKDIKIEPIKTRDYPTLARRPYFSVLEKKALSQAGISPMPLWQDALHRFLNERGFD